MANNRPRKLQDPGKISQNTYEDNSEVQKNAESGLELSPIGNLAAAVRVGQARPILVYNSDAVVHFVAFGAQGMAAPTGPTNGIPILPNSVFMVNSGSKEWIRSDSALVFGYTAENDV